MESAVDIAFDCLPLRAVGRVDVPIDASPAFLSRCQHLQQAIAKHGGENAYFLYNTRCVYRLANSDLENMLRFTFDGIVVTDRSDGMAKQADLRIELAAETCGPLPPAVLAWFHSVVEKAVMVEFNRFISSGHLAARVEEIGQVGDISDLAGFAGANV